MRKTLIGGLVAVAGGILALVLFGVMMLAAWTGSIQALTENCGQEGVVFAGSASSTVPPFAIDRRPADAEQRRIAGQIKGIGIARKENTRDIVQAVATAIQESNLRNLSGGHLDSVNMFQMRPSVRGGDGKPYWGTPSQLMDPVYAINRHYDEIRKIENRASLTLIEAAIAVQRPDRDAYYDRWRWDALAAFIVGSTKTLPGNTAVEMAQPEGCSQIDSNVEKAVQAALSKVGESYSPTGQEVNGFDGSGLMQWSYAQVKVSLPGSAASQYAGGIKVPRGEIRRGDLLYWARDLKDPKSVYRVAMYLGNEQVVEATGSGKPVTVSVLSRNAEFLGGTRPIPEPEVVQAGLQDGWQAPIRDSYRRSSEFNPFRFHPILRVIRPHNGTDLAAPTGTAIYAVNAGRVVTARYQGGYGNFTLIDHGGGVTSGYAHQVRFEDGISAGTVVKAGQLIGYVGTTGRSNGPHLHFEIKVNDKFVDPIPFMRSKGIRL